MMSFGFNEPSSLSAFDMIDCTLRKCTWSEEPESQTASLLDLCTAPSSPQGRRSLA